MQDQAALPRPTDAASHRGFIALLLLLLGVLALIGYWLLFSNFAVYDDEGYVLMAARQYLAGGGLYELVYSQYGPAFHCLMDVFQRATGSPVNHTTARLLTLAFWLGNASCCAGLVWRSTASRSLTCFTLAATFLYLYYITDEPFHPGSLIFFVLSLSLFLAAEMIRRHRLMAASAIAAGAGAILVLTKINVGAFYLVGIAAWAIPHAVADRTRSVVRPLVVIGLVLFAAAVMHTLLPETWVQIYLTLFATGALTLVFAQPGGAIIKWCHARRFALTGLSLGILILTTVWLRGTSWHGLLEGVLLGPLRHPTNYSYPVDWRPGSLVVAGLSLLLAGAYPWICRSYSPAAADRLIVSLRIVVFLLLLVGFALLLKLRVVGAIFSYVAPLIWIWVVPLQGAKTAPPAHAIRGLLATVLLLQYLHAYPVGGSQVSWGTFLFIPLAALGLGEVRSWLAGPAAPGWLHRRMWPALAGLVTLVLVGKIVAVTLIVRTNYGARAPLGLPGAGGMRLPVRQRGDYRILTLNAVVHANMLFSLPGMFSFNLWSELPPPTGQNTTLWFTLLHEDEQRKIIQVLERSPGAVVIVQESLLMLMEARDIVATGVLRDYLEASFTPAFKLDGFAFLVRTGRSIAPLNLAEISTRQGPDPDGGLPDTRLDFYLVSDGSPISQIEIKDGTEAPGVILRLDATNAWFEVGAVDRAGRVITLPARQDWPLQGQGLAHVLLYFDRPGSVPFPATTVMYLKGADGKIVDEVRLRE